LLLLGERTAESACEDDVMVSERAAKDQPSEGEAHLEMTQLGAGHGRERDRQKRTKGVEREERSSALARRDRGEEGEQRGKK